MQFHRNPLFIIISPIIRLIQHQETLFWHKKLDDQFSGFSAGSEVLQLTPLYFLCTHTKIIHHQQYCKRSSHSRANHHFDSQYQLFFILMKNRNNLLVQSRDAIFRKFAFYSPFLRQNLHAYASSPAYPSPSSAPSGSFAFAASRCMGSYSRSYCATP